MSDVIAYLLVWNVIVFISYGIDKRRAIMGTWRISERTLLLLSLILGGVGALIGGYVFHHKTQKWYFQLVWYTSVLLEILFLYLVWQFLN